MIIYLCDELVDLKKEITVTVNGKQAFQGKVKPDLKNMQKLRFGSVGPDMNQNGAFLRAALIQRIAQRAARIPHSGAADLLRAVNVAKGGVQAVSYTHLRQSSR